MRDQALFDKIDLHLIRVLHTVLTERSVSRAALRLGMHQPAVSAALKRLRDLAGDSLLVRSGAHRSEEHTSELQSQSNLVCRLLLEKKNTHTRLPAAPRSC